MGKKKWLTMAQVMDESGTSRSSLDLWRADEGMDGWTRLPNGQLRFDRDSMDDFMERLVVA
jgi:hypothetical protein